MTDGRRRDLLSVAILAAVPTLLFLDVLLGTGVFYTRDVSLYHFPQKKILHDIVSAGELPFWNPFYSAGQPLAANPAHEVFYPLTWLIFVGGLLYGFHLLALSHIYLATFSTYALLRSLNTTRTAAVIGGLSFGIGGLVVSSLNLFPFLFSMAWLPLTCLFTRRFLRERNARDFALASIAFAMQVLIGEPVTVFQTGVVLGLYALSREQKAKSVAFVGAISLAALFVSAIQTLPAIDHATASVRARGFDFATVSDWSTPPARLVETIYPEVFGSPLFDAAEPYRGWWLYPMRKRPFFGSIYSGLLIAAFAFAGVVARIRGTRLYLATLFVSILFAVGSHTPLLRILYDAGLVRSIRYPEKFLILGIFATVIFAALAFDAMLRNGRGDDRGASGGRGHGPRTPFIGQASATLVRKLRQRVAEAWPTSGSGPAARPPEAPRSSPNTIRNIAIVFAAATAILAAIAAAVTFMPNAHELFAANTRSTWLMAMLRGALLVVVCIAATRVRRDLAVALAVTFVIADHGLLARKLAPRTEPEFYLEVPHTIAGLDPNRADYRIFHIGDWTHSARVRRPWSLRRPHHYLLQRNALTGQSPAIWGVRTAVDVDFDLTTLATSDDFTKAAWVLKDKTPKWLDYVTAMSNVRYVALFRPIEEELHRSGGDVRLMQPVRFIEGLPHPRYYFATELATARSKEEFIRALASNRHDRHVAFVDAQPFTPARGRVMRANETVNSARIEVEAEGTAFLVMSVTPHKYWTVTIDGMEVPSIVTNLGYQGVLVPRGRHVVAMRYHNPLIAAGAAISLASLLALSFVAWRSRTAITMRDL